MRINRRKIVTNIQNGFIIIAVLLNSGHLFQVSPLQNYSYFTNALLLIFLFILIYYRKVKIIIDERMLLFGLILSALIFAMIFKNENFFSNISLLIYIINSYLITLLFKKRDIFKCFFNVICIISLISLFFYFLITVLHITPVGNLLNVGLTKDNQYVNLLVYFYRYSEWMPFQIRNQGVFWEPGMFSSFIILAIAFNIFFELRAKQYKIILLLITLLTTRSTAAYILVILLLLLWLAKYSVNRNSGVRMTFIYLFLIMSIIILIFQENFIYLLVKINPTLFSKLLIDNVNGSLTTRLSSPIVLFNMWISNPIFGIGMGNTINLYIETLSATLDSLTSTSFFMLASYGIGGLMYNIYWFFGCIRQKTFFIQKIVLFSIIILVINKEPHYNILSMWIFLFVLISGGKHENTYQ